MSTDHHHHNHEFHDELSFDEKLTRILGHWIKHNEDHALNYRNWAEKAKANGHNEAARLLEEAAGMSLNMNEKFDAALAELEGK